MSGMRHIAIQAVRWGVGILFILNGMNNLFRFPVAAILAVGLGLYLIPFIERKVFLIIKKQPSQWVRVAIAAFLFALFNLSLPKTSVEQLPTVASSSPRSSLTASSSASPISTSSALPTSSANSTDFYPIIKVVDGDTLKVNMNGKTETVRVVGINTPETVDPRKPVECFGKEASARAKEVLNNQKVRLESDATQSDRDRYHRLLRFVFLENGTDFGLQMIREGYAHESLYSVQPHQYRDQYVAAQKEAQQSKRGLWADDACLKN